MQVARKRNKQWRDLSGVQKAGVIVAGVIQVSLLTAALWDIRRRPTAEIRGSKALWTAVSFVNFVGPIAYFTLGRKHRITMSS